ncbi:DMT family transporter [Paludibaculum fermentans]|uniref:Guanidinium exporter n=1 Tax=Paludibaculum fermentans TaxID=1473598 RepID=A0A7S7NQR0_PALFE|nr:multidrug efflux SMR transporter [Paludibaculum fermentans]QOY87990.1 multidrug efflux SMR transporter [Paludibaculum fermentans]
MAWITLFLAGLLEIAWASFMKQSQGFTRLTPTIATFVTMLASFGLLAVSMKTLPLSTAYAVWAGIGTAGAFVAGIVLLGEQLSALRAAAALLIVAGLILMKVSSPD